MKKSILIMITISLFILTTAIMAIDKVKEDSTDLVFDGKIKFSDDPGSPDVCCIGAGVRKKIIVKVYAGAIYIDPLAAMPVLGKYKPSGKVDMEDYIEELGENNKFWNDFIDGSFHKVMVMRFVRDVGSENIIDAYKDGFNKYLKDKSDKTKADTKTFLDFFKEEIKDGQDMTLRFAPDGTILVDYAGKKRGSITNTYISNALLINWFGEDPVSDDIKESGIKYIFEVLK